MDVDRLEKLLEALGLLEDKRVDRWLTLAIWLMAVGIGGAVWIGCYW